MPNKFDQARESVSALFSDIISAERFKIWRAKSPTLVLKSYVLGEIFWRKSLGRPDTQKLSDAFTVEAWHEQFELYGLSGSLPEWQPMTVPNYPSWWDGKEDSEYWRVAYLVPDVPSGASNDNREEHFGHAHIVPHLKTGVRWKGPDGKLIFGSGARRGFEPPAVVFVKTDESAHFSFEVVTRLVFVSP